MAGQLALLEVRKENNLRLSEYQFDFFSTLTKFVHKFKQNYLNFQSLTRINKNHYCFTDLLTKHKNNFFASYVSKFNNLCSSLTLPWRLMFFCSNKQMSLQTDQISR